MNIEDNIIALLSGDITDGAEASQLLHQLAESPEMLHLFLQHTAVSQRLEALGRKTVPGTVAVRNVLDGVAQIEAEYQGAATSVATNKNMLLRRSVAWGVMLVVGFALGYGVSSQGYSSNNSKVQQTGPLDSHNTETRTELEGTRSQSLLSNVDSTVQPMQSFKNDSSLAPSLSGNFFSNKQKDSSMGIQRSLVVPALTAVASTLSLFGQVEMLSPNGGEEFTANDVVPVLWSGTGLKDPVMLEASSDGGNSWSTVAENLTGQRYLWQVPSNVAPGNRYLMRVTSSLRNDEPFALDTNFFAHDTVVSAIDISPDGKLMVTSANNDLVLWNLETRTSMRRFVGHNNLVYFARFSPDGTMLATGSVDGSAIVWNVADGSVVHRLKENGSTGTMWRAVFSPDGKTVATAPDDGSVLLWDVESGNLKNVFVPHNESVRYLEYTPDGSQIITSSTDRTAGIIDARTGEQVLKVVHQLDPTRSRNAIVTSVQRTLDGSVLITSGYGTLKFWNARTGALIREAVYNDGQPVISMRLSHNGEWLASVGLDGTTKLIDPYTGDVLATLTLNDAVTTNPMFASAYTPNDNLIGISHADGQVSLWRLGTFSDVSDEFWTLKPCDMLSGVLEESEGKESQKNSPNLE